MSNETPTKFENDATIIEEVTEDVSGRIFTRLDENNKMLNKILSSPALNGGFETLLFKVDKIEESQGQIVTKVDNIYTSIYHPDQGVFARIKDRSLAEVTEINRLEKELIAINVKHHNEEKDEEKEYKLKIENDRQISQHEKTIAELLTWKNKIVSVAKWVLVSLATASVSVLGKLLYDYFSGHMKFI